MANGVALGGHVNLGNNCNIGAFSAVQQFVRIGDVVMIGAMVKVTEDIIPYTIADGMPCRLRRVNTIGLQRAGFSKEEILDIRSIYKILFNGKKEFSSRFKRQKNLLANIMSLLQIYYNLLTLPMIDPFVCRARQMI